MRTGERMGAAILCLSLTMCGSSEGGAGGAGSTGSAVVTVGVGTSSSTDAETTGAGTTGTGSTSSGATGTGSTSADTGAGTGASSTASGGCVEAWVCSPWETDGSSDAAARTCTDINACGTTADKPAEAVMLPALDRNYYRCNVEPILDKKCSQLACHGTEVGRALRVYARGRLRAGGAVLDNSALHPLCTQTHTSEECLGSVVCACTAPHTAVEWERNYDAARGFALGVDGLPIPAGQEDTSELIAQPIVGGKVHAGVHLFESGDPDHTRIKAWLGGSSLPACDTGVN
jgi:hypothetical protein